MSWKRAVTEVWCRERGSFRFASVLLPFCFRYAGKTACHGDAVSGKFPSNEYLLPKSVCRACFLPFRFRFQEVPESLKDYIF